MAWCQKGDKPLFDPMMAYFTDMTAVLLWHVQNFVTIGYPTMELY